MAGKKTTTATAKGGKITAKATKKKGSGETPEERRSRIAEIAYLKWLSQSNGGQHPVSDEQTRRNWLEAEQELDEE